MSYLAKCQNPDCVVDGGYEWVSNAKTPICPKCKSNKVIKLSNSEEIPQEEVKEETKPESVEETKEEIQETKPEEKEENKGSWKTILGILGAIVGLILVGKALRRG